MKSLKLPLGAAALLAACLAAAVPLVPGTAVTLPGTTFADRPELGGTVVQDDLVPFSFVGSPTGGLISGTVQNRVVLTGAGTYDFYWRVTNDANSAGAVGTLRLGNLLPSAYDADWRADGSGAIAPSFGYLFDGGGGFVNFDFRNGTSALEAGTDSRFFFLHTDATAYDKSGFYDVGNVGQNASSGFFATYAPVPEPAPFAALGVGAVALLRRRAKRNR